MTATKKRARSSWCRRDEHVGCTRVGAICECPCHIEPVKPPPDPKARSDAAKRRHQTRRTAEEALVRPWITKEEAPCCQAKALPDGRPCIGYCSPTCVRRPKR